MRSITYKNRHNNILINNNEKYGCYNEVLKLIEKTLENALSKHSRVLIVRFDLSFPKWMKETSSNKYISMFMQYLQRRLDTDEIDPKYIWVREQSKEKHQHYHVAMFVNGNRMRSPYRIHTYAKEIWGKVLNIDDGSGYVNECRRYRDGRRGTAHYYICKDKKDWRNTYESCFKRLSYLAKTNTKGYTPSRVRSIGASIKK